MYAYRDTAAIRTHFASTMLSPMPKNGDQSFPADSALEMFAKGSELNGGQYGASPASPPQQTV